MIRTPFLWALVVILFVGVVIQLAQWNRLGEVERNLVQNKIDPLRAEHQRGRDKLKGAKDKRGQLEAKLLYREPNQLLPELTKVAALLNVSLVGVETLQERHRYGYRAVPVTMTFVGAYAGFTAFMGVVEGIHPTPQIDALRIYQRKRQEGVWLSLTLSMMTKAEAGGRIQMQPVEQMIIRRNPFDIGKFDHSIQPTQNKEKQSLTDMPQLIGILWDENDPFAILNHDGTLHTARVGTVIAKATVVSIEPQGVSVQRDGKRYTLRLWPPNRIRIN